VIARVTVAVAALIAVAWFAVLLRDHQVEASASDRLLGKRPLSNVAFAREMARVRDSELLDPGSDADLLRAKAFLSRSRTREVERTVSSLVRREPDNLEAWYTLLYARQIAHRRTADVSRTIRRIDPVGTR
jgi:hypothetical protein